MQKPITSNLIIDFIFDNASEEDSKMLKAAIKDDDIIRQWYLFEKRCVDIEKYHSNKLSLGESLELTELLQKNPKLREYFELSKSVNSVLEMETLYKQLNDINNDLPDLLETGNKQPSAFKYKAINLGKWVTAAFIVLLFVFSGSKYFFSDQTPVEDKLFAKYYEPFKNNTKNYFNSSPILKAKTLYKNNENADALNILESIPNSIDIAAEKNFYTGLVLMELNRYTDAIEKFETFRQINEPSVTLAISEWYLALSYLATENKVEAIKTLEEITANKSYNYLQANKILKKLN